MNKLILVLGDQLSLNLASLRDYKKGDVVLMAEVVAECEYEKHHKKKIAFILSAMRHFKLELEDKGFVVEYVRLEDEGNLGSICGEVKRVLDRGGFEKFVMVEPSEYRLLVQIKKLQQELDIKFELLEDDRFLASKEFFADWAKGKKELRMEFFYRLMRKKYDILMTQSNPVGGKWNYDAQNRKVPKDKLDIAKKLGFEPDEITRQVIDLVQRRFADHFGVLDGFDFAVSSKQALEVFDNFIKYRLVNFGDYQDAMIEGEPWMFHSHISFYLNIGLLEPLELIKKVESQYYQNKVSLNAVEGFIRQVLGWREYVRGIYNLAMPKYKELNFFEAKNPLPEFFWTGNTKMNCLKNCVLETKQNAYAHHIQRLMVLGNFALIAAIDPKYVNEWFMIVYADAFEWVELPNVSGMILFADGGFLASKPYAAGGSYINKMSNYCKNCHYDVKQKNGSKACPFNYLYWDFLMRNYDKLKDNQRLRMIYSTLKKMDVNKIEMIKNDSKEFLDLVLKVKK